MTLVMTVAVKMPSVILNAGLRPVHEPTAPSPQAGSKAHGGRAAVLHGDFRIVGWALAMALWARVCLATVGLHHFIFVGFVSLMGLIILS